MTRSSSDVRQKIYLTLILNSHFGLPLFSVLLFNKKEKICRVILNAFTEIDFFLIILVTMKNSNIMPFLFYFYSVCVNDPFFFFNQACLLQCQANLKEMRSGQYGVILL